MFILKERNSVKKFFMELIGTFFFLITIALTTNPFAIAAMLMAWVYIGGYVSGGHYNPAVSLAVAIRGKLSFHELLRYMLAQLLGGSLAFACATYITGHVMLPKPTIGIGQAFIIEILLAFVLAFVVLTVATSDKMSGNKIFGFAIGFTIPALAAIGGPLSGGLFNPAIAIGSAVIAVAQGIPVSIENLIMYVVGALVGGALAAYAFKFFQEDCGTCCKKGTC